MLRRLQQSGQKATSTQDAADDLISSVGLDQVNEAAIAFALIYMVHCSEANQYNPSNFISAIRSKSRLKRLDWQKTIRAYDIPMIRITGDAFRRLLKALLPLSSEEPTFDIQDLWGGKWQHPQAQAQFLHAYLLLSPNDFDPSSVPKFRPIFVKDIFDGASNDAKRQAEEIFKSPGASADAMKAVFDLILSSEETMRSDQGQEIINAIYQSHLSAFMLAAPAFASPWTTQQQRFIAQCLHLYLQKSRPDYKFVLDGLFRQSPKWVFDQCSNVFVQDPMTTDLIFERGQEVGWTDQFLKYWNTPLALDIACMRHRDSHNFDIEKYVRDAAESHPKNDIGSVLSKFLRIKADDEYRTQRKEQAAPRSIALTVKTVFALLSALEEYSNDQEDLKATQRLCLATYPRLMNYDEGFDEILDKTGEEKGNKLPEEIDKRMSDLFGKMYRGELSIRDVIGLMRQYKTSQDPDKQDLFCCIIHGLFDEYVCFPEYPLDALKTTAVLFGSIINYGLVSGIPESVGLGLILDAVRDSQPVDLMYQFGVEALMQLIDRLPEWEGFCSLLTQIPTLQGTEVAQKADDILRERGLDLRSHGAPEDSGPGDSMQIANGNFDDMVTETRGFRALHVDPPVKGRFRDPDQPVQEKILFVINNTSNDNMTSKSKDLKDVLKEEHYQWFASYLVEQRARLEPNNQEMYLRLLDILGDKSLMAEVLRETYASTVKMMNAEATITSVTERGYLKNLGGWLGCLTIARDKPIKHKNIYFVELLVEAYETQRLLVVIPFTCKVLVQGAKSTVFRPPNPWLMEIIGLLIELFQHADLKLNLKFEIEVLCKDLGLDHKKIEPTTIIRDRPPQMDDQMTNMSALPEGIDGSDEFSLSGNRGVRGRLSPGDIMATLPRLEDMLKYPGGSVGQDQDMVKRIIYSAFDQAIKEIIAPVVERSITIASISTAQLISKDYALEVDEEKYRSAARQMVRSLAGRLALVTCKEPLRMSIQNYMRRPASEDLPEMYIPEGTIMMFTNDNLDTACSFVEQAAQERAIPEIDAVIAADLEERRRFMAEGNDGRDFISQNVNRWATYIPEPYKLQRGGLNDAQRAVYDDFDRRVHGVGVNHVQSTSSDSTGRQIPDVLQESLPLPSLSTPAEQPVVPHPAPLHEEVRMQPSALHPARLNGFSDNLPPQERIYILISDVQKAARSSSATSVKELGKDSSIFMDFRQILLVLTSSTRPNVDLLARQIAEKICGSFFTEFKTQLETELMALLLAKLCQLSELTVRDVFRWMAAQEDSFRSNASVTIALLDAGLLEFNRIDGILAKALQQRWTPSLKVLSDLMDHTLFSEEPTALRADFAASLEAMYQWRSEDSAIPFANEIDQKLKAKGMPNFVEVALSDKAKAKQDQMRYVFSEWVAMYQNAACNQNTYKAFLRDIYHQQVMGTQEDSAEFLRLCIDTCVVAFEQEAQTANPTLNNAYLHVDALARLIILLVKLQGESNGSLKASKASYLSSMMSLIVLVQNHQQVVRGVAFNQRVFFRLFSSMLYEYSTYALDQSAEHVEMMAAFAETFLTLQPAYFPAFAYSWLTLVTHRAFISNMLEMSNEVGWDRYRQLMRVMLEYIGELLKPSRFLPITADLYKGVLKNLLLLYHDYPDFLCENHVYLCNSLPHHCTQLRNLILSAYPQAYQDVPDPLMAGLKVDRLDDMKKTPMIFGDVSAPLLRDALKDVIDATLRKGGDLDAAVAQLCEAVSRPVGGRTGLLFSPVRGDLELLSALVLHVGQDAIASNPGRFDTNSVHTVIFTKMVQFLKDETRYYLFNSIVDQVRFPNTHTQYFTRLMLHIFGMDGVGQQTSEVRQQIIRVILERLVTHRPHPWGLLIFTFELINNQAYRFWDLPFLVAAPQVRQLLQQALRAGH